MYRREPPSVWGHVCGVGLCENDYVCESTRVSAEESLGLGSNGDNRLVNHYLSCFIVGFTV